MKRILIRRTPMLILAALITSLLLAACGGSSSSSSSSTATGSVANETTTNETTESSEPAGIVPEPPLQAPTEVEFSQPLKKAPPHQKIAWLACELPICQGALSKGYHEAGEALGWEIEQINYNAADPSSIAKSMQQALDNNADGIAITGIPPVLFEQQAKEAIKKGVPIVSCSDVTEPEPKTNGLYLQCGNGPAVKNEGEELGNWSINHTEGKAKIVAVTIEEYAVLGEEVKGLEASANKCGSECSVATIPVTISEFGEGKVPNKLIAYLQSNPETNVVCFTFSDLAEGSYAALKGAGLGEDLLLVGAAASPTNLTEITEGKQNAWTIQPEKMQGWMSIDVLARVATGTPIEKYEEEGKFPTWVAGEKATAESILNEYEGEWPGPEGFQEKFEELWGV